MRLLPILIVCFLGFLTPPASGEGTKGLILSGDAIALTPPNPEMARALLSLDRAPVVVREDGGVPGWSAVLDGQVVGHVGSTWEIAGSVGYSGRPVDILVAVTPQARIAGAALVRHNEPILTLGISEADITSYVGAFRGYDLAARRDAGVTGPDIPDVISRATVSSGVIRDAILRTARTLAIGRGLVEGGGGIDRVAFEPRDWAALLADGSVVHTGVTMSQAHAALAAGKNAPPEGEGPFLDLWVALIDPPTIGRSLLGQTQFTSAIGALGPGESALLLMSRGLHSPRGSDWQRTGVFDRIELIQGARRFTFTEADFRRIDKLALRDAPEMKERSLFRLPADVFDPLQPFRIEVTATREALPKPARMIVGADYRLPGAYRLAPPPEPVPLWQESWQNRRPAIVGVATMLSVLTLILFFQESLVRRPKLWRQVRTGFLLVTFLWLGVIANGQLSVVQVVAFLQSLLSGFRWEVFLIEPVIFLLWSFVALGLLFWGRGVFCGWLCPFGALQELTNLAAQRLGVKQIAVPQALHERLWVIKYTLFVGIVAMSFYSMEKALLLAEVEPFKTAISLRMMRAWPFVLFVLAILAGGLFIERFYCRYLCPLGAGLAIPAKLKIFDWLKRRPQCGRECRLCETKCTVGAIDPLGRINPNECVLCLRCQVIFNDAATCVVLKRRARPETAAGAKP